MNGLTNNKKDYHFEQGDKITYSVGADGSLMFKYHIPNPFGKGLILAEKKRYMLYELEEATELFKQHVESKEERYEYPQELVCNF